MKQVQWHRAICAVFLVCVAPFANAQTYAFSRLDVRGNERLSDSEVLALCDLEGVNRITNQKAEAALQCYSETGLFKSATFSSEERTLVLTVEERPRYTGLLDLSVSADDDRGVGLGVYIEKDELFAEQFLGKVDLNYTQVEQSGDVQFIHKHLFGQNRAGGLRAGYFAHDYDSDPYSSETGELEGFALFPFGANTVARFSLGGRYQDIDVDDDRAGPFVQQDEGVRRDAFIGAQFNHQRQFKLGAGRDSTFRAGGSQYFYSGTDGGLSQTELELGLLTQMSDRVSLSMGASAGLVQGLGGRRSTIADRFQLGGQSLRGFAPRGIGPRENGFALGGDRYFNLNASGDVHLGKLGEIGFRSGVFAEAGSVWGLRGASDAIDDAFDLRSSAGISLIVDAGKVPIDLYYAVPISKQDQDETQRFGFSVRSNF